MLGALMLAALSGCDVGDAATQPIDAPPVALERVLASLTVDNGKPSAPQEIEDQSPTQVLPSTALRLRFSRYLIPSSVLRQAMCLRPDLSDVSVYTECSGGVLLQPSYDPVRREVVLRQEAGKRLALNTKYKLTLFAATVDDNCNEVPAACGIRAFDGAPLDKAYTFTFTTLDADPGPVADDEPPAPVFCGATGAFLALQKCSSPLCHAQVSPGPAMGLDFSTVHGIEATAINRVAHQTQTGEHADDVEETPSRFGRSMAIVRPGSPGDSYMMYKILTGLSFQKSGSKLGPSDEEITRLRGALVVGMPMPPSVSDSSYLSEAEILGLSDWIAGGAPTLLCP